MGTHRSRHNKGRKPLYKEHRLVASKLIENAPYSKDAWYFSSWYSNQNMTWTPTDEFKLEVLCESDSAAEQSADVLGRQPKTLAHRARDCGLTLPRQWAHLIAPKRKPRLIEVGAPALAYPYLTTARPEHADLLEINSLVPACLGWDMRADICQEIMIAILEKRTTLEMLRARRGTASYFIRKFYKENFEDAGHALSFSTVDEDRSYDEIASSIAAKEWHRDQVHERTKYIEPMTQMFTRPVQFEAAWQDQIGRRQMNLASIGQFLSRDEVEELLEEADTTP
jgi:hypothetical protein